MASLSARGLVGIPEVRAGDDLAALIVAALTGGQPHSGPAQDGLTRDGQPQDGQPRDAQPQDGQPQDGQPRDGQVVVIAHKAVSKAEGAVVALADVQPGGRARELAAGDASCPSGQGKDARAVQVVLDESAEILRAGRGLLICRTRHGFVCANAGVDASNASDPGTLVLLPRDPDASARRVRARLRELTGATVAVLVTDSFGRPWRHGQCDVAIGCAGMAPLDDWRGRTDASGQALKATWLAVADAAAAVAELARAKDSREPVVILDGLERFVTEEDGPGAAAILRPPEEDLFR